MLKFLFISFIRKDVLFESLDTAVVVLYGHPFNINGQFLSINHNKTFGLSLENIFYISIRISVCNNNLNHLPLSVH
ncbi:hypothetical protein H1220_04965 [Carnobacteriaceae bacterium zg-84]|nr:hypothetical protein H1220_04965 [Carnobacteriaceae bacterium zg-84]